MEFHSDDLPQSLYWHTLPILDLSIHPLRVPELREKGYLHPKPPPEWRKAKGRRFGNNMKGYRRPLQEEIYWKKSRLSMCHWRVAREVAEVIPSMVFKWWRTPKIGTSVSNNPNSQATRWRQHHRAARIYANGDGKFPRVSPHNS